jgi:hypothetical protein
MPSFAATLRALAPTDELPEAAHLAVFHRMAERVLHGVTVLVAGAPHRFTELEFYCNSPAHPDTFTHGDVMQEELARWYFHRSGGEYKGGTYKGLDIAVRPPRRARGDPDPRRPSRWRTALHRRPVHVRRSPARPHRPPSIAALVAGFDRSADAAPGSPLHITVDDVRRTADIHESPRIGLTLKRGGLAERARFLARPYRLPQRAREHQEGSRHTSSSASIARVATPRRSPASPARRSRRCPARSPRTSPASPAPPPTSRATCRSPRPARCWAPATDALLGSWPHQVQVHLPDVADEASSISRLARRRPQAVRLRHGPAVRGCRRRLAGARPTGSLAIRGDLGLSALTHSRCLVYATPGGKGTAPHFDQNINLVLQLHGAKKWWLAPNRPRGAPADAAHDGPPGRPGAADLRARCRCQRRMPEDSPGDRARARLAAVRAARRVARDRGRPATRCRSTSHTPRRPGSTCSRRRHAQPAGALARRGGRPRRRWRPASSRRCCASSPTTSRAGAPTTSWPPPRARRERPGVGMDVTRFSLTKQ